MFRFFKLHARIYHLYTLELARRSTFEQIWLKLELSENLGIFFISQLREIAFPSAQEIGWNFEHGHKESKYYRRVGTCTCQFWPCHEKRAGWYLLPPWNVVHLIICILKRLKVISYCVYICIKGLEISTHVALIFVRKFFLLDRIVMAS